MASNPDDFLRALIGTTGMRPIQEVRQGEQQIRQGDQQLQIGQMQIAQAQQKAAQDAAFQQDTQSYFAGHLPLRDLVAKYPNQAEQIQKASKVLDEPVRKSRVAQFGSIYNAAKSNRPDLLVRSLEGIRAAEKEQGIDTSEVDDAISAINSGDKNAIGYAQRFAEMNLAALDPEFAKSVGVGGNQDQYDSTGDGAIYNNRTGDIVREAPAKPLTRMVDVFDRNGNKIGERLITVDPSEGGDPGTAAGGASQGGDIVARMIPITLGAEGGGTLSDPKVSPKGARGPMQVMPGTNLDPGFGVRPAQDASETERARVGRDYLAAMVQRYGNPAKAWAAYNAGPGAVDAAVQAKGDDWLQALPAETKKYVSRNMARLQRGGSSGGSSQPGARVLYESVGTETAQKPRYHQLTEREAADRGLPSGVLYQEAPDGKIEALPGQRSAQLKPIPAPIVKTIVENRRALRNIDDALGELTKYPNGVGLIVGNTPNWISQRTDPRGVAVRSAISNIGSLQIHDRSGAAVTVGETPRLLPFVPLATDDAATARKKLVRLRSEMEAMNADYEAQYGETQGYRPFSGADSGAAPKRVRSIQEAQKLPPGTRYIRPDGKVMVR